MPATLRASLLPVLNKARGIIDDLGFRTSDVVIRTRRWVGERSAEGDYTDDLLPLRNPRPRVRTLSTQEVAASGGKYELGDLRIDKLTPRFAGPPAGGYTPAQLDPPVGEEGVEVRYVVTGAFAGEYAIQSGNFDRALGYSIVIRRTNAVTSSSAEQG